MIYAKTRRQAEKDARVIFPCGTNFSVHSARTESGELLYGFATEGSDVAVEIDECNTCLGLPVENLSKWIEVGDTSN